MAQGAALDMAGSGPNWVGDALNGGGSWSLRGKIPVILGILMLFDSWDSVVIAYTLPSISAEWGLSALEAGWLISSGYGGQFLGAIGFGMVAEKAGRLPVLRPLVIVMSLLALVCGMVTGLHQLMAVRFIQGIAIGGALPIAICYVNEVAPTATRGKFFGTFQFLMLSGFGLAALLSIWIVPNLGWRAMFLLGAVPLLLVPVLYFLPESPRWLSGQGRAQAAADALAKLGSTVTARPQGALAHDAAGKAAKVPLKDLFAPDLRRKTGIVTALWFLTSLVSFGLLNWVPTIYVQMFNIPVERALSYNSIVAVSIFLLPVLLRQTIDRIGRRPPAIIGTAIGGFALLAILVTPPSAWMLVVGLVIVGQIGISVGSMILWPYTAEIYDTRVRSVALGAASSIARGASMLTPLLVGGVLELSGSIAMVFLIFGIAASSVALLWWRATTETAGREMGI